ncbi:MAG: zinc-ribbon and DUF3426 domain-containing protein [Gammaproteobacteria bacterium]
MFTRCTECKTLHSLPLEQLRHARGMMRCSECSAMFDALIFIHETEPSDEDNDSSLGPRPLPWDASRRNDARFWTVGLAAALLLLSFQIIRFESPSIMQNHGVRLWAEKAGAHLGFKLPAYQNADEFEILHRSLSIMPDQNYLLNVVFSNQAPFRQPYPNFRLTFFNYNGQAFAERVFYPSDYLSGASAQSTLAADATTEINLKILAPKTKVGGYDFDFSY